MLKKTTFGILAASLIFSQAAFAESEKTPKQNTSDQTTVTETAPADEETGVSTSTEVELSVSARVVSNKLDKIKAKYEQFVSQEGQGTAQAGKLGSIQNRVDALKAQLEELAQVEAEVNALDVAEAEVAVDSLTTLYADLEQFERALQVQQNYVKKLKDAPDEQLLKEYKEIGKLLKKMGKVGVKALVNGQEPNMDVEPMIENDRTLVPFRALAEALGAEVEWNDETKTVTVTKDDATVVLTINSMIATVDGKEYTLDVPAKIVKDRTVVPLRFLSQGLKAKVLWEQETKTAIVIDEEQATDEPQTEETSATGDVNNSTDTTTTTSN